MAGNDSSGIYIGCYGGFTDDDPYDYNARGYCYGGHSSGDADDDPYDSSDGAAEGCVYVCCEGCGEFCRCNTIDGLHAIDGEVCACQNH